MARSAPTHVFLSPGWITAVRAIRDEYAAQVPDVPPAAVLRANVIITEAPFEPGEVRGSIDTSKGLVIEPVELESPDLTATLDYDTAKALFVGNDPQALLQAFFGGKIRITGDATKLLGLPMPNPDDQSPAMALAREVAARVKAITT
jgi:hypothetical protein